MKLINKKLSMKIFRKFNSMVVCAGLIGYVPQMNSVQASPDLCKDKLTQTTSKKNIFSENTSGVAAANLTNEFCLGSPDRFELVIYEMGLCTQNPIIGSPKTFTKDNCVVTMTSASGSRADLAGAVVNLPSSPERPPNATYTHAFMTILNEFGLRGSITLAGTKYCSTNTGGVNSSANCSPVDHTEELDDFDGETFSADFGPETMPTGGKVSALLTDSSLTRAANAAAVTRLVAVFETNSGSPVVITDSVNGLEVELQVADGGYGIMFDFGGSGVPEDFGSAPFKPLFTTF